MPSFVPTYDAENKLVAGLQSGDRKVFDQLYKAYAPVLLGYISKLTGDQKSSEEALQKSFIEIWNNREQFDPEAERLFTWMLRITKSITLGFIPANRYLTNKKAQTFTHKITDDNKESAIKTAKAMLQNHLLELMHFNNYSLEEAAAILNIEENIVRSALRNAIGK